MGVIYSQAPTQIYQQIYLYARDMTEKGLFVVGDPEAKV